MLQACIFEIVAQDESNLPVPAWAFADLGRPVEPRNFRYEDIIYASGLFRNHWQPNTNDRSPGGWASWVAPLAIAGQPRRHLWGDG